MKNKRILGMLLTLCLLCVSCSPAEVQAPPQKEQPTIRILTIGETDPVALERVSAALSEITSQQVGCRVELCMIREDQYDECIDNLLLESDFVDIFVCRNRTTMNKLLDGSYIYRLDRYLNRRPALRAAIGEESAWAHVKSQGYTYGIPFGNDGASSWGFLMRQDVCSALGIDAASIRTLEQLHEVLMQVHKAYPDMIPVVTDYGQAQTFADRDLLISGAGCLVAQEQVEEVCNLPEFWTRCALMEQWYEEGLILSSGQLNQSGRDRWMADGLAFGSFAQLDRYTGRELEYSIGAAVECAVLEDVYYSDNCAEMSFAVYAYTEDVDLCLRVLELIYTDPDVLRLCIYGQEDVDYTLSEQGAALPTGDSVYRNWCWPMRDLAPAPVSAQDPAWYRRGNENAFAFDNRTVSNEIYQCGEILEKYYEALCTGAIDAEEGIARMKDELEGANVALVRDKLEQQWSAWNAETE